ncbi:MAG: hypothetical protein KF764_27510 [Labilithrix sp.]|nr:hypothetical protein [Labilithrix sp.]MBX3221401.1 hypothetical protein [Labilithrix sp.]
MGTWGTALYSDDLAADVRNDLRDLIGDGLTVEAAVEQLMREYDVDSDETGVFWLAVADTAWRLGRPHAKARDEALRIIESESDLSRWENAADRRKREAVLRKLADELRSPAPSPKRVARPYRAANDWSVGEVVSYRLASGRWTAFRVIGHHTDKGGRSAICEPLDWIGDAPARESDVSRRRVRRSLGSWDESQFLFGERRLDGSRLVRTGISSTPQQTPRRFLVFVAPHGDRLLAEVFGLE